MILRNLPNSPARIIPAAMALIASGLGILVGAIVWLTHPVSAVPAGATWNGFLRGAAFGFAIVLEATGVVLAAVAAAARDQKP